MYERSIKTINGFRILPEAEYWMERELKSSLGGMRTGKPPSIFINWSKDDFPEYSLRFFPLLLF